MQLDYFVLERAGPSNYPLLEWDALYWGFGKPQPVAIKEPVRLRLGDPVPRKPVMVDHHSLPEPVISTRLKEVLEPLELFGVQFVPADVKVREGEVLRYWLVHVYNEISCLDRQQAKFTTLPSGRIFDFDRLVLDEKVLGEIPLERRRVFILAEWRSAYLFHRSIVEKVLALQPEGLRFFRVDEWSDSAGFRP
ncbi:imm11 family protein [Archangium sp.]|uniref:imm11 family protein n=1 Tax=Archangium sp. TaxID=1872627 RepID=UPI002D718485|nr:DUF1629 domain-containing protein [Archangium sp.]HYO60235.1 DUF1629 domain-containing protein [Archangium sp.]